MSSIIAILQARTSSSRLPGKVLKKIVGQPMLALQIERILRSQCINKLIVATSDEPSDDAVEALCRHLGVTCFRGSLNNVLARFYHAAKAYQPDHVVRLTADCPLTDWTVIDKVIALHLENQTAYCSNCIPPTLPDGLDVEIFTFDALKQAYNNAATDFDKEHVTPYFRAHPTQFKYGNYAHETDLSAMRWTVDYPEDFEFVSAVYEALYQENSDFLLADILNLLEQQPEIGDINKKVTEHE